MSVHVSKILYDNPSSKFHCCRNISLFYPLNNYLLLWLSTYISYDDDGGDFVVLSRHIARSLQSLSHYSSSSVSSSVQWHLSKLGSLFSRLSQVQEICGIHVVYHVFL